MAKKRVTKPKTKAKAKAVNLPIEEEEEEERPQLGASGSTRDGPRYVVYVFNPKLSSPGTKVYYRIFESEDYDKTKEESIETALELNVETHVYDRLEMTTLFTFDPLQTAEDIKTAESPVVPKKKKKR